MPISPSTKPPPVASNHTVRGDRLVGAFVSRLFDRRKERPIRQSRILLAAIPLAVLAGEWRHDASAATTDAATVVILCPDDARVLQTATAIKDLLSERGYRNVLVTFPRNLTGDGEKSVKKRLQDLNPTAILAGGTEAATVALESTTSSVLFFLVPNALDAPFLSPRSEFRQRAAGITTDVAPERQIARLLAIDPRIRRVGVLCSERSARSADALRAAGLRRGISVTVFEAAKGDFGKAVEALDGAGLEAVVMVPDAAVYNSHSVQRLLLWGIRQKRSVWAFSANVVKAGAVGGQFADQESIVAQTVDMLERVLTGTPVNRIGLEYPQKTDEAFNERTAELIGVSPSPEELRSVTVRFGGTP